MATYPPGHKVLRIMPPAGPVYETPYLSRTYYEGRGDEGGLRCERWNGTPPPLGPGEVVVGAFVPLPTSQLPEADAWAELLEVVRALRGELATHYGK